MDMGDEEERNVRTVEYIICVCVTSLWIILQYLCVI